MRTLGITILLLSVAAVVYFWLMFMDHVRHARGPATRRPGRRLRGLDSRGRRLLLGGWLALALAAVTGLLLALV